MNTVERIKQICKERGIAISRLEKECGFSNGYIRGLKEGKMPSDRLYTVSKFLDVPFEYLQTGIEAEGSITFADILKRLKDLDNMQLETLKAAIDKEWSMRYRTEIEKLKMQIAEGKNK